MSRDNDALLDLFIIGGGINGAGIANDASGRGLSVALCEQNDLASATSSASSKLIHGGLRYLEHYEFRLVREALQEREVLLKKAPHIIWPLRFILPHQPHLRPAWMIRAGLFLYDHIGKRETLPASKGLKFGEQSPLVSEINQGFEYSDCWVDDARLVITNALQAREQGAEIMTGTRCVGARDVEGHWELTLEDVSSGETFIRRARTLVNAAGPWVESFIKGATERTPRYGIRMIQGSHLIVPRINTDDRAFILQNKDKRIVFVLPYQEDFSLIGTTDVRYKGDPSEVACSSDETDYMLEVVNHHFKRKLGRDDVVSTFSGVRPLCDDESADPSAMTRDYTLHLDDSGAPMLSIFGGKITTYRKLAESALEDLKPLLPSMGEPWTHEKALPGGDIESRAAFTRQLQRDYPFLGEARARRFASSYGSLCLHFLDGKQSEADLGEDFGAGLSAAEIDYLVEHEWAREVQDVVWRRTKLTLRLSDEQKTRIGDYLKERLLARAA
ncbi:MULTISPECIES: glycerol-3-phosphate dehydrogenase [Cobetia]|uniref:glycerol-3-phosphate dehydrogenase n=1 Tax=Cobetia TaxID=204286 RepID=UPI001583665E|nr:MULTISPECIES: glycerol-3-phosphate dehydrogenase [Cobetia]MDI4660034.1 glycerol-3-phosphate dehydrogenase [Cobetia sp. BMC6]MDL2192016.1 glycerol-3-phosphate dehydrogenase [Cobetia sp. LC6]NUJ56248.1 glycerol-3-phosphate dehydrogenase [Cobetia marina]